MIKWLFFTHYLIESVGEIPESSSAVAVVAVLQFKIGHTKVWKKTLYLYIYKYIYKYRTYFGGVGILPGELQHCNNCNTLV